MTEDYLDLEFENRKIKELGIHRFNKFLYCIKGEHPYDGDPHTIFIYTDNPVEIIAKIYKRTYSKNSHDIIFLPEVNLMFDHGDYTISYKRDVANEGYYLIRLYCRPLLSTIIYNKYEKNN